MTPSVLTRAGRSVDADAVFPFLMDLDRPTPFGSIGWIPDFQHVHAPEYFDAATIALRDAGFRRLAVNADAVLLSSRDALAHYREFAPSHADKGTVASFPSSLCFRPLHHERGLAVQRFNLPARYALVINQFWRHKNLEVVVDAAAAAARHGVEVPIVMVGTPADGRDPENGTVSAVLQRIALQRLGGVVTVLGKVDFEDLVDLLRCSTVVIQPSKFEGWSTTVEDAKCVGRPVICSDIAVHREQAPHALGFFTPSDAEALAAILAQHFPRLHAGSSVPLDEERASVARGLEVATTFGETLLRVADRVARKVGST
jgi:glycosyltransferase involved in cell wall biosynthesis